ncbi:MAG: hypothetical protein M3P28_09815, partial [Thermoproteota archaeon]|nr:hypothetical protein [Thermoproteota archaeon]
IAANTFPSTTTNSGPFSLHFISTLAMTYCSHIQYISRSSSTISFQYYSFLSARKTNSLIASF